MDDEGGAAPGGAARDGVVRAGAAAEAVIERRLRRLSTACAVPAAVAVAVIGAIVWTAEAPSSEGWLGSPSGESFLMAVGALLLVILSSAARARVLRDAREERSDEAGDGGGPAGPDGWAGWLRVYSRATGISFAMLGAAVALGGMAALRGRAPFYGLVICLASLLAMIVRWPRRSGFEVAMDGAEGHGG
jgi:hypothetical protein